MFGMGVSNAVDSEPVSARVEFGSTEGAWGVTQDKMPEENRGLQEI